MKHWKTDIIDPETKVDSSSYDYYYKNMHKDMEPSFLQEFMDYNANILETLHKLGAMAELRLSTNQKDQEARRLKARLETVGLEIEERSRPIWHWLQGIGENALEDKNAHRLFSQMKDSFVLFFLRDSARYTLPEREENLISKKDVNGISVINQLRSLITTSFTFEFQPEGQNKQVIQTQSELTSYFRSANPEERKAAYIALLDRYDQDLDKLFTIYQAVARDWGEMAKLRGYSSPISVRNHDNQVPDEAVQTLLDVCTEKRYLFHEFFSLKGEILGKKLSRYDIYAPISTEESQVSYEEAEKTVLDTFKSFSERFHENALKILDGHIDTHPNPDKRGGAFAMAVSPNMVPFVMLNFTGRKNDIFTLAHELGHGVHFLFSKNHSIYSFHAPLPLAETASTFAEMVVFQRLYDQADDKDRKAMLVEKLSDSFATIIRQNYFVKFELIAHEMLQKGCTMDELSAVYYSLLEEQFGDSVEKDSRFKNEWAIIPHIVRSPFYCYSYNFGELLSLALYSMYQKDPSFIHSIEKILSYGGSKDPAKILDEVGIDMSSPDFWKQGFCVIEDWLTELKRIKHI